MDTLIWIMLALLALLSWLLLAWRRLHGREREPYVSARARIEGGGVKRGLSPAEGAILLGRPLHVALTLVIFDLLRKGFVRQVSYDPLRVEMAEGFRTHGSGLSAQARGEQRRRAAQALSKPMHIYEEAFIEILEANPGLPVHRIDYGIAIQPLVRYVAGRVGGYDLEDSRAYYRLIIERAPREARSDGVLTTDRQKVFDRNFGWVLLGDDYAGVLDQDDYSYVPVWLRTSEVLRPTSFAVWANKFFESMQAAVSEDAMEAGLEREGDGTTVTLMNDIARATFRG
jgi:hypothetical protein